MSKNVKQAVGGKKRPTDTVVLPPVATSSEAAQQFELELCWCVQQLEAALSSNKLNPRQAKETSRALNILKNNTSSVVKKRQVMNMTFGDYRAKMVEEEKKYEKASFRVRFDSKSTIGKSRFIKQCSAKLFETSDKNFKFNFAIEEDSVVENNNVHCENNSRQLQCELNNESNTQSPFKYQPSNNDFRFDFNQAVESDAT